MSWETSTVARARELVAAGIDAGDLRVETSEGDDALARARQYSYCAELLGADDAEDVDRVAECVRQATADETAARRRQWQRDDTARRAHAHAAAVELQRSAAGALFGLDGDLS